MFRIVGAALQGTARTLTKHARTGEKFSRAGTILPRPDVGFKGVESQTRNLSCVFSSMSLNNKNGDYHDTLLRQTVISPPVLTSVPSRSLTKYSLRKGKRKTVKTVIRRFYRLDWGMWIRTKAGRNKRKWRKTISRKRRAQRHVMTTASQSWLLDTMVTKFWRRPKHYVDDPYAPYHKRESFPFTRTKPLP